MPALSPDVLAALARYDTPTVCNVIELCNVRPRNAGYFSAAIKSIYPEMPPMVGYAVTATFRSAKPAEPGEKALTFGEQIARWQAFAAPRVLVVQDLDDPPDGAVYGEIVATVLKSFGFIGLVTNGYARDLEPVRALGFPCFAAGVSPSHAYCRWLEIGVPVSVGGITVHSGDLIHGDMNGVTTVPLERAGQIARGCKLVVDAESILIEGAKAGKVTPESYDEVIKRFMVKHEAISKELSGQGVDERLGV